MEREIVYPSWSDLEMNLGKKHVEYFISVGQIYIRGFDPKNQSVEIQRKYDLSCDFQKSLLQPQFILFEKIDLFF